MVCKKQVACLLVMAVFTTGVLAQLNDTHYPVEFNGETIHCKLCPTGTYWIKHCSQDGGQTGCQECPDGRYKTENNRALYCERCTKCKGNDQPSGEILAEACSRFQDTKCECKPGYCREEGQVGDCREVSPCMPGYGVKKLANSHKDTTCERCVNRKTFSNISSEVMPCQNCSLCQEGWVQKTPCTETVDTVCIPKEDGSVGYIVGAACGVIFAVAILVVLIIIAFCCRERTNEVLQKLRSSWRYSLSQKKHDDEEQANPLKQDRRRQENHGDEEQADPLQQDRRRQENHDDEEQANPLLQDRRRHENHVDEEQANPLQRDRRRQENHDDEEEANPLLQDRRRHENHDGEEQANQLQQDRRRQENHVDEEQAIPLQQDIRRQENNYDEEQANALQQDRRRRENHVDVEQVNPLQQDRRRQENHDDEEQANPLQQERRRQENHDDEEQANPLPQDRQRQENHDDEEQANPLQQGGTPDKSEVKISRQQ